MRDDDSSYVSVGACIHQARRLHNEAMADLRRRGWRAVKRITWMAGQQLQNREWTGRVDHLATDS